MIIRSCCNFALPWYVYKIALWLIHWGQTKLHKTSSILISRFREKNRGLGSDTQTHTNIQTHTPLRTKTKRACVMKFLLKSYSMANLWWYSQWYGLKAINIAIIVNLPRWILSVVLLSNHDNDYKHSCHVCVYVCMCVCVLGMKLKYGVSDCVQCKTILMQYTWDINVLGNKFQSSKTPRCLSNGPHLSMPPNMPP